MALAITMRLEPVVMVVLPSGALLLLTEVVVQIQMVINGLIPMQIGPPASLEQVMETLGPQTPISGVTTMEMLSEMSIISRKIQRQVCASMKVVTLSP